MYNWRTATKPTPDIDGQIHIDEHDNVWEWNATSSVWVQKKNMYLKEVAQIRAPVYGIPVGNNPLKNVTSVAFNEWDSLYNKAFIRTELLTTGFVENLACFSQEELSDYVASILDGSAAEYYDVVNFKIYQVFDPAIRSDRTGHSNVNYALMRGRHSYGRRRGRNDHGLQAQYGIADTIHNNRYSDQWHVDTGKKMLNAFYGVNMGALPNDPNENNIFYFHRGTDNFYHLPKVGSNMTLVGRWWYSPGTNTYINVSEEVKASLGTPKFFGTFDWSGTERTLQPMTVLMGNRYLSDGKMGVVIYPVIGTREADGTQLRAFLIKPYSVDCAGLGIPRQYTDGSVWNLVAENSYPDSVVKRHKIVPNQWVLPDNDLVTFLVKDTVKFGRAAAGGLRLDSTSIPKKLDFYLQHRETGVRSELLGSGLQIVRRKNCMPVGVLPAYR